jgi:transposase
MGRAGQRSRSDSLERYPNELQPRIGVTRKDRQAGQPDHVLQIAWGAQHRLYRTHQRLCSRGKPANVATVALARELAGFLGAAVTRHDLTADP